MSGKTKAQLEAENLALRQHITGLEKKLERAKKDKRGLETKFNGLKARLEAVRSVVSDNRKDTL